MNGQSWGVWSMTSASFASQFKDKEAKKVTAVTAAIDDAIQQMVTSQKCRDYDVTERRMN